MSMNEKERKVDLQEPKGSNTQNHDCVHRRKERRFGDDLTVVYGPEIRFQHGKSVKWNWNLQEEFWKNLGGKDHWGY